MASGDKNYDIAKESSQQTIINNITAEVADKATLDSINTKIDTLDSVADNIYAKVDTEVAAIKSVVDSISTKVDTVDEVADNIYAKVDTEVAAIKTVADNIYGKVDTEVAAINTLIGATNNTGGSATAGTVMAKLNAIYTNTSSSSGGGVKSVQRGTTTAAGTVTINAVNTAKTFVYSVSKGSTGTVAARGTVSMAAATVSGTHGVVYARSYSGSHTGVSSDGSFSGTVAAHTGTLSGGTTNLTTKQYSAVLTNSTTLTCDGPVEWQVIEYL